MKSNQQLIREIHTAFEECVDVILNKAENVINSFKPNNRLERLNSIGAIGTNEYKQLSEDLANFKKESKIADLVKYYLSKYPLYKFITHEMVTDICKQYGLVFGEIRLFKGDIPEKNLIEIENFKIEDMDWQYESTYRGMSIDCTYEKYLRHVDASIMIKYRRKSFNICAPKDDMKIPYGYSIDENLQIVKDDPIVLAPVNGGYLVVSKWGLEASDEKLINPIYN